MTQIAITAKLTRSSMLRWVHVRRWVQCARVTWHTTTSWTSPIVWPCGRTRRRMTIWQSSCLITRFHHWQRRDGHPNSPSVTGQGWAWLPKISQKSWFFVKVKCHDFQKKNWKSKVKVMTFDFIVPFDFSLAHPCYRRVTQVDCYNETTPTAIVRIPVLKYSKHYWHDKEAQWKKADCLMNIRKVNIDNDGMLRIVQKDMQAVSGYQGYDTIDADSPYGYKLKKSYQVEAQRAVRLKRIRLTRERFKRKIERRKMTPNEYLKRANQH